MKTYWEKLRDPRWQKKRLQVMERDGFECQECGDKTSTLNVHHKFYRSKADPWDYESEWLVTLCESCHRTVEAGRARLFETIVQCSEAVHDEFLVGYLLGRQLLFALHDRADLQASVKLSSDEEIRGALSAWTQGREVGDFSKTGSGESMYRYIISRDGTASLEDPEIRRAVERTVLAY